MQTVQLVREFRYKQKDGELIKLPDPNPAMTPEEVLEHYTPQYPELNTALVVPLNIGTDKVIYDIKDTLGTKG